MLFYTTPKTKKYEEKKEHFSKNIFYNETCENLNTNEKKKKDNLCTGKACQISGSG